MVHLDKDAYLRKNEAAGRRMADNAKISTLTEEQHEALAELCQIRHEMHTCGNSMFNSESGDFSRLHSYFTDFYLAIEGIKCPNLDTSEWESDDDYSEAVRGIEDDNERDEVYFRYIEEYQANKERLNRKIEVYLKEIDEKHGTEYCPSGVSRLY